MDDGLIGDLPPLALMRTMGHDGEYDDLTYEQAAAMPYDELRHTFWDLAGSIRYSEGDWLPANFPKEGKGELTRDGMLSQMLKHSYWFFPKSDQGGPQPKLKRRAPELTLTEAEAEGLSDSELRWKVRIVSAYLAETYGDWLPERFISDVASTKREQLLYAVGVHHEYFDPGSGSFALHFVPDDHVG